MTKKIGYIVSEVCSEAVLTGQVITPELIAKADTSIFRGPLHD